MVGNITTAIIVYAGSKPGAIIICTSAQISPNRLSMKFANIMGCFAKPFKARMADFGLSLQCRLRRRSRISLKKALAEASAQTVKKL